MVLQSYKEFAARQKRYLVLIVESPLITQPACARARSTLDANTASLVLGATRPLSPMRSKGINGA